MAEQRLLSSLASPAAFRRWHSALNTAQRFAWAEELLYAVAHRDVAVLAVTARANSRKLHLDLRSRLVLRSNANHHQTSAIIDNVSALVWGTLGF